MMEYYSAIKKNEILQFASTWMDLENIIPSEIVRERQIPHDFTHMWNLRNKTKKRQKNRPLTIQNKLMVVRGEVERMDEIGDGN